MKTTFLVESAHYLELPSTSPDGLDKGADEGLDDGNGEGADG
eukprot:CAMPEP_0183317932 /NCGR_PEP_ID=MMETSP0160_2-20130417/59280_1 /TAXON_ID=2839 ORGANISM="Odontella Sinensis, Strain Grunow 1884" /NCGR_SAMPLE_ID=MMETSP0160_2 /ASSEMBLY_ACC=CAM_ASM_000250 /LENGTH=41 /DNA_ID= /DNA_START= /DNA_END= /DNA_ORIENTATION=